MQYMEECRGNSGTTYVTETIHSSFQLITITFFSHKASHHPRTPHTHDLINDNPASSKNFPDLPLFLSHPPTKPSIDPSKIVRHSEGLHGSFGLPILHLEFPRFLPTLPRHLFFSPISQESTYTIRLSWIPTPTLCHHLFCRPHSMSTVYHLRLFLTQGYFSTSSTTNSLDRLRSRLHPVVPSSSLSQLLPLSVDSADWRLTVPFN